MSGIRLAVCGIGKLGLPLSLVMAKYHDGVIGVDISEERIRQIAHLETFEEPSVNEYLKEYYKNLHFTTNFKDLKWFEPDLAFIVVQTPSLRNGKFDRSYVVKAVSSLRKRTDSPIFVTSTLNPHDTDDLNKRYKWVYYNPEMVAQGTIIRDMENPKYLLIGCDDDHDYKKIETVWRKITNAPIFRNNPVTVEFTKLGLNFSLVTQIMQANTIGGLARRIPKVDTDFVLDVVWSDIRRYKDGLGFSGPCFPRDVNLFGALSNDVHFSLGREFATFLDEANESMVLQYFNEIMGHLKYRNEKNVGIIGIAYKSYVLYLYESQSLEIAKRLLKKGVNIHIFDPIVGAMEKAKNILGGRVNVYNSFHECIDASGVIFIGNPLKEIDSALLEGKAVVDPWRVTKTGR